jgi:predicted transcriptional regulator
MNEREVFSTRINGDLVKSLKHLAIDLEKTIGDLLEEAIADLLKKYERKTRVKKD